MGKVLRIGGPNLVPPQHVWIIETSGDGRFLPTVKCGQSFDFDSVHDAQGYVDRGQATVESAATESAPLSITGIEDKPEE